MNLWSFIQSQVLGMDWLNHMIGALLEKIGVDITGKWGGALKFFL